MKSENSPEKLHSLKELYDEDQDDRRNELWKRDEKGFLERDAIRLQRVLELIENDALRTPSDYLYAAMILQHGPEVRHSEMAYQFAKRAAKEGFIPGPGEIDPLWLSAAAKDRALMRQGKPQWYGTQRKKDTKNGPWYVYPVDPDITDEDRAKFHVPPLAGSYQRAEELNKADAKEKEQSKQRTLH